MLKVVQILIIRLAKVLLTFQVPMYNLYLINKQLKVSCTVKHQPRPWVCITYFYCLNLHVINQFQIIFVNLWGQLKGEGSERERDCWKNAATLTQNLLLYFHLLLAPAFQLSTKCLEQVRICFKYWSREFSAPENIHALSDTHPSKECHWKSKGMGRSKAKNIMWLKRGEGFKPSAHP